MWCNAVILWGHNDEMAVAWQSVYLRAECHCMYKWLPLHVQCVCISVSYTGFLTVTLCVCASVYACVCVYSCVSIAAHIYPHHRHLLPPPQAAPPWAVEGTARRWTEQEVRSWKVCVCARFWLHWWKHHQGGDTGNGSQGTKLQRNRVIET